MNLSQTWARFIAVLELIRDRFELREKIAKLQDYAVAHPVQALFIAMVLSLCSIPVIGFIIFSCITMIITFIGFLCFEGFLLSFGALALGAAVFVFAGIAIFLSTVILGLASTYTGSRYAYQYLQDHSFSEQLQEMYLYCMRRAESWTSGTRNQAPVNNAAIDPGPREHHD